MVEKLEESLSNCQGKERTGQPAKGEDGTPLPTLWLCHYFLAHKLHFMVKSDLVKYLLTRPILYGRLACWLLKLSEFDIICVTHKAIKS
ncbi:hypothetical protein DVH24_018624 [Malus domestica]|uniref:Uncharacterized protein n=1 Tax=Malus domestica TaxID=3750 RepID=A0A498HK29_MALDO|nr:hypothetical protein DVH24_018624 [Malus domestica]